MTDRPSEESKPLPELDALRELFGPWGNAWLDTIAASPVPSQERGIELTHHGMEAKASKPSARWMKRAVSLLEDRDTVAHGIETSLTKLTGRNGPELESPLEEVLLKGLCWLVPLIERPSIVRPLRDLAEWAYRKRPRLGPRSIKVGNAAIAALGEIGTLDAAAQLAYLAVKLTQRAARTRIDAALATIADKRGLTPEEIREVAIPTLGLTDVGILERTVDGFTMRLEANLDGSSTTQWTTPDGKARKSIPAAVRNSHPDLAAELSQTTRELKKLIPAQKARIDSLFLERRIWPFPVWRERYLEHPLVGLIARRLIWSFHREGSERPLTGTWHEGRIVDPDGTPLTDLDATTVELWHPIGKPLDDVLSWRHWFERNEIRQPFKQAHREVYLLTEAERRTGNYSNRYASHILRQHQFHALSLVRGWTNTLRLAVDNFYAPPAKLLPQWGLRAEFWIEGAGDARNTYLTESGAFAYVVTDQVRFYPIAAQPRYSHAFGGAFPIAQRATDAPLPLTDVPPLVLSEILRDVDLFVGVSSVGNDPTWSDGGPDGRFRDYWAEYSFGDLTATGTTRKDVLERLIPRLKIADRCHFDDRFLIVRGDLRTYRIHLGSGNILMSPNDQYLCIVPDNAMERSGDRLYLPFEGDRILSLILSKALLLADDTAIRDPSIVLQIRG